MKVVGKRKTDLVELANQNIKDLLNKEFLITNGIGGYSSSSICFANTRKYHGLLVASDNPPTERNVLVHKMEERIVIDGQYHDLSTNKYGDEIYPQGYTYLKQFERRPIATWRYSGSAWAITKQIMMVPDSNTTVVTYSNEGDSAVELELHPLFTHRDYHSILQQNDFDFYYELRDKTMKVFPFHNSQPIYFKHSQGKFIEDRTWYKNFAYDKSAYRGIDAKEDSYRIGYLSLKLKPGKSANVVFSTDEKKVNIQPNRLEEKLRKVYAEKLAYNNDDSYVTDLSMCGDQFLVNRASTKSQTILAGYHWFTDWGRDTMIAMRGLTISTGRKEESESILKTFFNYLDQGMLPNRFPDYAGQEVEYNTIDATLWLFVVMYEYYKKFGDKKFVKKFIKKLESVIQHHVEGTRYQIKMNTELGLIQGGVEGVQLTWMDAKVNGLVVTPRVGAPVEINVLWYNALNILKELSDEVGHTLKVPVDKYIALIKENFKKHFLNDKGYLNDNIERSGEQDDDFRCNQIYAVSLPFSLLTKSEEKEIVRQVEGKLLTPYGLRTLDQENEAFVPKYGGDNWSRDTAYHQGTVWPFFIAEYFEAFLKVNSYSKGAKEKVVELLNPLKDHFYNQDCIHGISEIFDGKKPLEGRGCINQAWSVSGMVKLFVDHQLSEIS